MYNADLESPGLNNSFARISATAKWAPATGTKLSMANNKAVAPEINLRGLLCEPIATTVHVQRPVHHNRIVGLNQPTVPTTHNRHI